MNVLTRPILHSLKFVFPVLVSLALMACSTSPQVSVDPLTLTIPWPDQEEAHYLLYENGQEVGRGTLRVAKEGATYRLEQDFQGSSATDTSLVVADAMTLKPQRSERTITGESPTNVQATYQDDRVNIATESAGPTRTREVRLPENSYDNDSSLFIWRALPFTEEYRARYTSIITIDGSRIAVVIRVLRRETVDTPAGRLEAWRVIIDAGRSRQIAWYTTDDRHHLVRYDNGRTTFILQRLPS